MGPPAIFWVSWGYHAHHGRGRRHLTHPTTGFKTLLAPQSRFEEKSILIPRNFSPKRDWASKRVLSNFSPKRGCASEWVIRAHLQFFWVCEAIILTMAEDLYISLTPESALKNFSDPQSRFGDKLTQIPFFFPTKLSQKRDCASKAGHNGAPAIFLSLWGYDAHNSWGAVLYISLTQEPA